MENQHKIDVSSMQGCTESYNNPCWVMRTDENKMVGVLRSKPFETLLERINEAMTGHFDSDTAKIVTLTELADEIHEIKLFIPTDIEEGYHETIEITPAWEY